MYMSVSRVLGTGLNTIALVSMLGAASLVHVEEFRLSTWSKMRVPKWSNGAFVNVQYDNTDNPTIWTSTRNGQSSLPFSIPEARSTLIYDWDRGLDGTLAVSGSAVTTDGKVSGFVARITPDQKEVQITRTGLYTASMVAVAPDGCLWTVGTEHAVVNGKPQHLPSSDVVRRFDQSGKMVGSFIPRSTVKDPLTLTRSRNTLRAVTDRVAWYSVDGRYLEFSLSGSILTDISVALPGGDVFSPYIGLAMTNEGTVYLSAALPNPIQGKGLPDRLLGVFQLDRANRSWKPLAKQEVTAAGQLAQNSVGYLYGADGQRLVLGGHSLTAASAFTVVH